MSNNIGEWIIQKMSKPRSNIKMSIIEILFIALREKYYYPKSSPNKRKPCSCISHKR